MSSLSVDQLASSLVSYLRDGGLSSIGYKKPTVRKSMKSKALPRHVLDEIGLKRHMEQHWKTLSSCNESSHEDIVEAEATFLVQSAKVEAIFSTIKREARNRVKAACSGKSPSARKMFWGAVTGKVKQTTDMTAVKSSSGVLKSNPAEICEEIEKHFCTVL